MALIRSLVLTTPSTDLVLFDSRESQLQDLVFTLYLIHLNSSFLIKKIFQPSNLTPNETRDGCSSQGILRTSLRLLHSSRLGSHRGQERVYLEHIQGLFQLSFDPQFISKHTEKDFREGKPMGILLSCRMSTFPFPC